eukprot:CAMPEP_0171142584 /NCGR_PEP_ID=MMETSP0766_2-20121228/142767_1 /TAXON_ID=439317 /ORGANISM="Gambierdiscus australes, Strain CAWD 149" /LENGTH=71 /DNA_ID=CAMNT_0011606379 /DNA_START=73 /DNA_END=285 /DNA_ORIENTATION=+
MARRRGDPLSAYSALGDTPGGAVSDLRDPLGGADSDLTLVGVLVERLEPWDLTEFLPPSMLTEAPLTVAAR